MLDEMTPEIEVLGMDFVRDPYSLYERLREERPVQQVSFNGLRMWLVTRYDDVRRVLTDPRLSSDPMAANPGGFVEPGEPGQDMPEPEPPSPGERMMVGHLSSLDPPDHSRLRKLVSAVFTKRRVESLRPEVERIADGLLSGLSGQVDMLHGFAFPLTITVISELLGISEADRERFAEAGRGMLRATSPEDLRQAADEIARILESQVAAKRANPDGTLISGLIQVRDSGDGLSEEELVSMVFQLLVNGYDTTAHVIGNGILALLSHPDQLAKLRADRSLLPQTIEEFLRYESSLHVAVGRYPTEPIEIGEVTIPKGEFVVAALGSANRDHRRYPDPDQFDITRDARGHTAFAHGIHHCLGAPLARLVAEVAVDAVLNNFGELELAVPPAELRWQLNMTRGLEELPVRVG